MYHTNINISYMHDMKRICKPPAPDRPKLSLNLKLWLIKGTIKKVIKRKSGVSGIARAGLHI